MSEKEPTLDQLRKEFEAIKTDLEREHIAFNVYQRLNGAIPLFELGVQLGKGNIQGADEFITEIREYLADELITEIREYLREYEQRVAEQLYPDRRRK